MTAFKAILIHHLRAMLREKVALCMLLLLAGLLMLLPSSLRDDGSLDGALRLQTQYSMGLATVLVAFMTLWCSASAISADVANKRLQHILSLPLRRSILWLGRWTAVILLSSTLLFISAGVTLFRIHRSVQRYSSQKEAATLLRARHLLFPEARDYDQLAKEFIEIERLKGSVPDEVSDESLMQDALAMAQAQSTSVRGGDSLDWNFQLERPLRGILHIEATFDRSGISARQLPGSWQILDERGQERWASEEQVSGSGQVFIPVDPIPADLTQFTLRYRNLSPDPAQVLFFQPGNGVRLVQPAGSFTWNLLRATLLLCGLLALLAALGMSAGALFSLPVACYVTAMLLLLELASGTLERAVSEGSTLVGDAPNQWVERLDQLTIGTYKLLLPILQPLNIGNPLAQVAEGIWISNRLLWGSLFLRFTPLFCLLALIGILLFSRREVASQS